MRSAAAAVFLKTNPDKFLVSAITQHKVTKTIDGYQVTDIDGTRNLMSMAQFQGWGRKHNWLEKPQSEAVQADGG